MNQNNEKSAGEISPEQQDEVCLRYEGSYTRVYLLLLCTIPGYIFFLYISGEKEISTSGLQYLYFKIVQILVYITLPFVAYIIFELGIYIINGIKANVVFYKDHFEVNNNRFGLLNYKINYRDMEMIEDFKIFGSAGLVIHLKEPLSDTCSSEFRPNNLLAPVNRIIKRLFSKKPKIGITTSAFDKKTYETIYVELIQRLLPLQETETPDTPSAAD